MATANDIRTGREGLGDRLTNLLRSVQEGRQRRRTFRNTLAELNTLSNRELSDLGLKRTMATSAAADAAANA